jgi:hypothetical protein
LISITTTLRSRRGRSSQPSAVQVRTCSRFATIKPNDDLRRIDWNATARTRHLIVREFSAEDDKKVTIFLDEFVPPDDGKKLTLREKLEAEQVGEKPGPVRTVRAGREHCRFTFVAFHRGTG